MPSPEAIIGEVAIVTGVPAPAILSPRRTRAVCAARYLAAAALRQSFYWWPLQEIAAVMMRRDHSSIIHMLKRHHTLIESDADYRALANSITIPA